MKKMYRFLYCITLLIPLLFIHSCNKEESDVIIEGEYIEESSIEEETIINYPVYISSNIDTQIAAAIAKRTANRVSSTDLARIAFITGNELTSALSKNYVDSNKILVIFNPSAEEVKQIASDNTIGSKMLFAAYNADGEHCLVPIPVGNITYSESINGLVKWINNATHNDLFGLDPKSIFEKCFITHNYNYQLKDKEITHVIFSKADKLSGSGVVELGFVIYPLHGFGGNGTNGMDYYIVESTISVVSDKMYSGNFTKKHGGVHARICGFYWKKLHSEVSIVDAQGASVGQFVQTPSPATVVGATTYNSEWNFSYGGAITGGTGLSTTLGSVSHTSSTSRSVNDCDIISNHTGSTASYDYIVNNLPSYNANLRINPPQAISVKTATFYSTWIWAVPTSDNDNNKEYYLKLSLSDFVYGASYFYSSKADYHDLEFEIPNYNATILISKPSRYTTGQFVLINTENNSHISNIRLKSKTHPEYPEILIKDQYAFGGSFTKYVPSGEYTLECDIMKNGEKAFTTYKYTKSFKVLTGGTVKLASGYGFVKK